MQLFFVHGMGRSPVGLLGLARSLRRVGYTTSFFSYSVALRSFPDNAARLLSHIRKNTTEGEPFGVVAHSLGAVLTRFISPELPKNFRALVMLGPPNRPVLMAKRYAHNHLYRRLTGTSGQLLGDDAFYATLPIPKVPTLVIAGTRGRIDPFSPFGSEPNDGIVSVAETMLPGAEFAEVRAFHTLIMNDPLARLLIFEFLSSTLAVSPPKED